ncbi:MAG: tetratricopeptide repeat protein [Bacteroidales bacterium]|nr:tetratricopeptide repeat protein [Bacteroidales bacterium]
MNKIFFIVITLSIVFSSCNDNHNQDQKNKSEVIVAQPESDSSAEEKLIAISREIAADTMNADLYHQRSSLFLQYKDYQRALRDMAIAIQLNSNNAEFFITLGDVYKEMSKFSEAKSSFDRAISIDKTNIEAKLKNAEILLAEKDYEKSKYHLDQVAYLDAKNAKAFYLSAIIFLERGDTLRAMRHFHKSIEYDQDLVEAYRDMGLVYAENQDPMALEFYNNMLNVNPEDTQAYYLIGLFYQNSGDLQKAERSYQSILQIDSTSAIAYYNLGYLELVYKQEYQKAINYFDKAIESNEYMLDAYYNRGYSYELAGIYRKARVDYDKVIQIEPKYEKARAGLIRMQSILK